MGILSINWRVWTTPQGLVGGCIPPITIWSQPTVLGLGGALFMGKEGKRREKGGENEDRRPNYWPFCLLINQIRLIEIEGSSPFELLKLNEKVIYHEHEK
jgi:hypothetical protein